MAKASSVVGNVFWIIFGGLLWAIALFIEAIFQFVIIIGIPVGLQLMKMAKFALLPFGKKVKPVKPSGFKTVINVLWAITFGWVSALGYLLFGVILCITIIGIPFGKQYFKMARFILTPLGYDFVNPDDEEDGSEEKPKTKAIAKPKTKAIEQDVKHYKRTCKECGSAISYSDLDEYIVCPGCGKKSKNPHFVPVEDESPIVEPPKKIEDEPIDEVKHYKRDCKQCGTKIHYSSLDEFIVCPECGRKTPNPQYGEEV